LRSTVGDRTILRIGMVGTVIGVLALALTSGAATRILVLLLSIAIGLTYAGTVNIMLNGLGIVLSPRENPGFLPGLNAGAFQSGRRLELRRPVRRVDRPDSHDPTSTAGYMAGMLAGAAILGIALAASFLIPRPMEAEEEHRLARAPRGTGHA
jgi:hypothetical protein